MYKSRFWKKSPKIHISKISHKFIILVDVETVVMQYLSEMLKMSLFHHTLLISTLTQKKAIA
jgi:hypothetical protein